MDRNSAIGLSLIAIIFVAYIYLTSNETPPPAADQPVITQSDTIRNPAATEVAPSDSTLIQQYGDLGAAMLGTVTTTSVENEDLALVFNNHGSIHSVELKKFKTYYQKPLILADPASNQFGLTANIDGRSVDLYKLIYQENRTTNGDTTVLTYTANIGGTSTVTHTYLIPKSGYQIGYKLQTKGLGLAENLVYNWRDNIPVQEKQLDDSRIRTTANWYTVADGFDNISENSQDREVETVNGPIQWASFRQKFFVSSIIGSKAFSAGEFTTLVNVADTAHVKDATMKLFIPVAEVKDQTASFKYYFGPNDYRVLDGVAENFQRNVYLGWPPVKWVNQFIILPIFHVLETVFSNYGVIIMILVLIIRLLLTPLSYSSYLGMAKMRLLKPELDVIKEKNGDNVTQTQQDQMKLYQQAGVNPFSGCIPLLLQMPILLAMCLFLPGEHRVSSGTFSVGRRPLDLRFDPQPAILDSRLR